MTEIAGQFRGCKRQQVVGKLAQSIVDTLGTDEGVLMLLRQARLLPSNASLDQAAREHKEQARAIAQAMDGLPLALDQAGADIEETRCALVSYLTTYQQKRYECLEHRGFVLSIG